MMKWWLVTHVLLTLVYAVAFIPIGLAMRFVGYDPLKRRLDPQAGTYWLERRRIRDVTGYFRQF